MSPRTKEQYEFIRQEKKELILNTALKLFAEKGYESTSISTIAREAKISKGLIYNYFESKEALLLEILNQGIDEILSIFDTNKDGVLEADELKYFIEEMFRILKEERELWKLYYSISFQPTVFSLLEPKIEEFYQSISELLFNYFEQMGFENPKTEMLLFGALMDGISIDYVMKPDLFPMVEVKQEIIRKYCNKQN
ncbi:MAG: TetR/AcrR family transcriptional regulator [Bacteroidota bacterium]